MKNTIQNTCLSSLGLLACLAVGSVNAQPAAEQAPIAADLEHCPPRCEVRIDVPSNQRQEPNSRPETLEVVVGETVNFAANVRSRVIFTGSTPFIDERGNRVFQFEVNDSGQTGLRVADDEECSVAPGCKYIIIDATNPGRPARDPYIIVRR